MLFKVFIHHDFELHRTHTCKTVINIIERAAKNVRLFLPEAALSKERIFFVIHVRAVNFSNPAQTALRSAGVISGFRTQCAGTHPPCSRMGQTQRNLPDAFSGNRLSGLRRIIPSSYMRSTPSTWSGFPLSPLWYRRTHGSLRLLTDIPGMHGHIHAWWRPHLRLFRWSLQNKRRLEIWNIGHIAALTLCFSSEHVKKFILHHKIKNSFVCGDSSLYIFCPAARISSGVPTGAGFPFVK